ncbi:MAG TPA: bifunctional riboflavin kinase/FAD synthetase [Miltoncostaeaceae bacterium]|nr:bifunctional riboflavin kinase/FAD synthetase [Miltoncostaeaceae bacterium]
MKYYGSLGELPLGGGRRVIAIGTFDGVHRGHRLIIGRAIEVARERGLPAMVLTFEPQPIAVLRPELRPTVLTHLARKRQLIEALGVDELLVAPFTRSFARVRAESFAEMLCSAPVNADGIVVGRNFRFGHGGTGTADWLASFGRTHGISVEVPSMLTCEDGKPISSTRIRRLVATGQVEAVIPLLGRRHSVEGPVVPGAQRGRTLGFPTANLDIPSDSALPGRGVYAAHAVVNGLRVAAAVNIGTSPTFTEAGATPTVRLEAFLIDYDGADLYGRPMRIEFVARLRDERRFDSAEALVEQMHADVAEPRRLTSEVQAR